MRLGLLLAPLGLLASCASEHKPAAAARSPDAAASASDSARAARCPNSLLELPQRPQSTGPVSDSAQAVASLASFLADACRGRYDSAMALYVGDWRRLARAWGFGPADTVSPGAFLRVACSHFLARCDLKPSKLVRVSRLHDDTLRITLELAGLNGHRFEPPPCCGTTGPPDTLFDFYVVRIPVGFRSISLPVYRP